MIDPYGGGGGDVFGFMSYYIQNIQRQYAATYHSLPHTYMSSRADFA